MGEHLLFTLRFHEDGQGTARYHGTALGGPEWPPSPARLFQAIVAGSARGGVLPEQLTLALEWLERLPPPIIAAPRVRQATSYALFVPNNDADAVSNPRDVSGIRTKKSVQPLILERNGPLLYAWSFDADPSMASHLIEAADRVYQLGRGTDMAWASAEIVDDVSVDSRLREHSGIVYRPDQRGRERLLACPVSGSLASLIQRHRTLKLTRDGTGRAARILFTNPPKARFVSVSYEHSRERLVYELKDRADAAKTWPWALHRVVILTEELRDAAAARLRQGIPAAHDAIERALIGRRSDGSYRTAPEQRIRLVPVPSIGHEHADRRIRRVLLEVPSGVELSAADVEWAFSGLEPTNSKSGEGRPFVLVRTGDHEMLRHYLGPARHFRSVTPVALPEAQARRRIDPEKRHAEAKKGTERKSEEDRAVTAVHVALRHAGVRGTAIAISVQREPFEGGGSRVEAFSEDTRFAKERLWHVELEFDRSVDGPLVIGDGRFLGLGLMAPVQEPFVAAGAGVKPPLPRVRHRREPKNRLGLFSLVVARRVPQDPESLARALRRAVMSRVQDELGDAPLNRFLSGHEPGGGKAHSDRANHLAFHWDPVGSRFLIIAPNWLERREPFWEERASLDILARALEHFRELRTNRHSVVDVQLQPLTPGDPLLAPTRRWFSATPYTVTRHLKRSSAADALTEDVIIECKRRGLPMPAVTVLTTRGVPSHGLQGNIGLTFSVAVGGPILLGKTRYLGGGLFAPDSSAR